MSLLADLPETYMATVEHPDKFHPGKKFSFPKREFGAKKEKRSFRAEWCEKYPWLHYDLKRDVALCHLCTRADHERKFFSQYKTGCSLP